MKKRGLVMGIYLVLFLVGISSGESFHFLKEYQKASSLVESALEKKDPVSYPLAIKVNEPKKLSFEKQVLLQRLQSNKPISFSQLTDFVVWDHEEAYLKEDKSRNEQTITKARQRLTSIIPTEISTLSAPELKQTFETQLQDHFQGKRIRHRATHPNILHTLLENTVQSYSGTSLFHIVARQMGKQAYRDRNFVVIATEGKFFPGYLEKGTSYWKVYGVDMTREGKGGPIYFGRSDRLNNKLIVIDAEAFTLVDLFRGEISNPCEVREQVIHYTKRRYGIEQTHASCNAIKEIPYLSNSQESTNNSLAFLQAVDPSELNMKKQLGAHLFAFGKKTSIVPAIERRLFGSRKINLSHKYQFDSLQRATADEEF